MINIKRLNSQDKGFDTALSSLLASSDEPDASVTQTVSEILQQVRHTGDQAMLDYTNRFDRRTANIHDLTVSDSQLQHSLEQIPNDIRQALIQAAERIESYHQRQKIESWTYTDDSGTELGQQVTPLDRVGVYVPGGKAAYPSSVLMNVIPAKVAGVKEIIMVVPTPDDEINDVVMAAAKIAGVDKVFTIGGAQAVAALAYGTETVPKVDKIVGPGNIYVATAKRMVFGTVGIDMIAGPSEVLVVSDGETDPDWLAMDLFAQAEHDEEACSILLSPSQPCLDAIANSIDQLLPKMERCSIIKSALESNGALIKVSDWDEACDVINRIAPEHLELSVADPRSLLPKIRHAGAIFMGRYTAEALGDYCAGPNHVLPTARTARFSSPLGVYDFQKRSSIIHCSDQSASRLAEIASPLARGEGLTAHAQSAEYRLKH